MSPQRMLRVREYDAVECNGRATTYDGRHISMRADIKVDAIICMPLYLCYYFHGLLQYIIIIIHAQASHFLIQASHRFP